MLYSVPKTFNGPDLLFHKAQTLSETNGLNQARRARVFPQARKIDSSIRLKDGRTLSPRGLSGPARIDYARKSAPYLSGRRRGGLGDISDLFSGIKDTITGTVSAVTGTVAGVANAAQPLEQLLQNNPSLVGLVKSYIPTASQPQSPTIVIAPRRG